MQAHYQNDFIKLCDNLIPYKSFTIEPFPLIARFDDYEPTFFNEGILFLSKEINGY